MKAKPLNQGENDPQKRLLGSLPAIFYLLKVNIYFSSGEGLEHALWFCNLACLLIGIGIFLRRSMLCVIGVLWLSIGIPLWLLDLLSGAVFAFSSALIHLGGMGFGLFALRSKQIPPYSWLKALILMIIIQRLTWWLTPATSNVNLSHAVWKGWETTFPSYGAYLILLFFCCGVVLWAFEKILRKLSVAA